MQNGNLNKHIEYYAKKKRLYLLIIWSALLIGVGIFVGLSFVIKNEINLTLVGFVLLIILFFLQAYCKEKISFYNINHKYHLLLSKSLEPQKTKCTFSESWLNQFSNYTMHLNNENFLIFYKITSTDDKIFKGKSVLQIVTIFKNNENELYSSTLDEEYKKIWIFANKEKRTNKQIILQFKKYPQFNNNIKKELDSIIAYSNHGSYLITINCGYFEQSKSFYFLHSNSYFPNIYYKYAVEVIKELTSK